MSEMSNSSDAASIQTQAAVGVGGFLVIVSLFSLIHRVRPWPEIFFPKDQDRNLIEKKSLFCWLPSMWVIKKEEVLRKVGPDAVMMLIFIDSLLKIFVISFPFCMALFGINYSQNKENFLHTIEDIQEGSNFLIAHIAVTWVLSIIFYLVFDKAYDEVIKFKRIYSVETIAPVCSSVIIQNLPESFVRPDSSDARLLEYLESIQLGPVVSAIHLRDSPKLRECLEKRFKLILELESLSLSVPEASTLFFNTSLTPDLQSNRSLFGSIATTIGSVVNAPPALEKFKKTLQEYLFVNKEVCELRQSFVQFSKGSRAALVTFENPCVALLASKSVIANDPKLSKATQGPEQPQDLIFASLITDINEAKFRRMISKVAIFLLTLLTLLIVAFLGSLVNIDALKEKEPFTWLLNSMFASVVRSVLPTILVTIYFALIPIIFNKLAIACRFLTKTETLIVVFASFYYFEFFNVIVGFSISGTVFQFIKDQSFDWGKLPETITIGLTNTATFFFNMFILQTGITLPMSLLQIVPVAKFIFKYSIKKTKVASFEQTPREKALEDARPLIDPIEFVQTPLFMSLGLIYLIICPIIILPSIAFSVISWGVWRYRLMYGVRILNTNGSIWRSLVRMMHVSLILSTLTAAGSVGIKKYPAAVGIAPLFLIHIYKYFSYNRKADLLLNDSLESLRDRKLFKGEKIIGNSKLPQGEFQGISGIEDCSQFLNILVDGELPRFTPREQEDLEAK